MKRNKISGNKKATRDRSDRNLGLCTTCLNESACTYVRSDEAAVVFCEEFRASGELRNSEAADAGSILRKAATAAEYEKAASMAPKELCTNCATSGECIYSQSGDNRWFCEEYS